MDKLVIVSVRLSDADLRRLQLLAQVYQRSVGEIIRSAVGKHIEQLTGTEEFKIRALELKEQNEATLKELLELSSPAPADGKIMRSFPRNIASLNISKISTLDSTRDTGVYSSLVKVEVGPPSATYGQIGAAASHKTSNSQPQRSFTLKWKQGEDEWTLEGKDKEVVLASRGAAQPAFIIWKNLRTGKSDRFELRISDDGRILVDIPFSKALMRVEAVSDNVNETERREMLPAVHHLKKSL